MKCVRGARTNLAEQTMGTGGDDSLCENVEEGEHVAIEFSTDGSKWARLPGSSVLEELDAFKSDFEHVTMEVPSVAQERSVRFRWVQHLHSGESFDVFALDDVSIYGWGDTAPGPGPEKNVTSPSSDRTVLRSGAAEETEVLLVRGNEGDTALVQITFQLHSISSSRVGGAILWLFKLYGGENSRVGGGDDLVKL